MLLSSFLPLEVFAILRLGFKCLLDKESTNDINSFQKMQETWAICHYYLIFINNFVT